MKIGIITSYPPSKVTLNEYAFHLVKSFKELKDVSEIVLFTDIDESEITLEKSSSSCKISVQKCWTFNSFKNPISIAKAVKKEKPDAVLYNLQFMKFGDKKVPAALGLLTPWITKLMGVPSIVLLHNIMETVDLKSAGFTSNKLKIKVFNFIGEMLTRVVLKSDHVAVTINKYVEVLQNKYGAQHVSLIPHGTFEVLEEPIYNTDEDNLKVMAFGKFGTYKKVENLIEAVTLVNKRTNKNIEVVIAGTDNPNTPGYLQNVQKTYNHLKNITFTGYVAEEDVPVIFAESAIVVFPYTSTTGSSGVLHQAGSYGKAVVMPNLGDLSRLVKDEGYRGEFFEPTSVDSLANAIEKLTLNINLRVELAKANYEAATAFPMDRIASMYVNKFNELILKKQRKQLKKSTLLTS